MGVDKKLIEWLYSDAKLPYIKVLAFRSELLKHLSCESLIIRKKDIDKIKTDEITQNIIDAENKANLIFNAIQDKVLLNYSDLHIAPFLIK